MGGLRNLDWALIFQSLKRPIGPASMVIGRSKELCLVWSEIEVHIVKSEIVFEGACIDQLRITPVFYE